MFQLKTFGTGWTRWKKDGLVKTYCGLLTNSPQYVILEIHYYNNRLETHMFETHNSVKQAIRWVLVIASTFMFGGNLYSLILNNGNYFSVIASLLFIFANASALAYNTKLPPQKD